MSDSAKRVPAARLTRAEQKRVLAGTLVGTTFEWYDFMIYAQAAGLVFAQLFFTPAGKELAVAQLASWATLGISFLVRPLGGIAAGYFGDRYGRRPVLVATLLMMGAATTLIGLLPTYATIGVWAPVLLVLLRVIQGFSAGGEWGGAALLAVEHAPPSRRGAMGAYPQLGVPLGLILASGVIAIVAATTTTAQFLAWGWRVPFLLSVILIVVGYLIRRSVAESPVFNEVAERKRASSPLATLFRSNTKGVLVAAFIFLGVNASGYMLIAFFASFAVRTRGFNSSHVLLATTVAAAGWLVFTLMGGRLSDRLGRIRTTQIGYVLIIGTTIPLFAALDSVGIWLFAGGIVVFSIGNGLAYGPIAALFAELFPAHLRFSGISIGYALGAILGGAFAPLVADVLLQATGSTFMIGVYIAALSLVSLVTVSFVRETRGRDLFPISEDGAMPTGQASAGVVSDVS
jgi:MFS family permease